MTTNGPSPSDETPLDGCCEECGEEQLTFTCEKCGTVEVWCPKCQRGDYGHCEIGLCLDCNDEAQEQRAEYAKNVEINVKILTEDLNDLRTMAVMNAEWQKSEFQSRAFERGEDVEDYTPNENRAIISFLRHNATNYDSILEDLPAFYGDDDAYEVIRSRVHEALQEAYPEIDFTE